MIIKTVTRLTLVGAFLACLWMIGCSEDSTRIIDPTQGTIDNSIATSVDLPETDNSNQGYGTFQDIPVDNNGLTDTDDSEDYDEPQGGQSDSDDGQNNDINKIL